MRRRDGARGCGGGVRTANPGHIEVIHLPQNWLSKDYSISEGYASNAIFGLKDEAEKNEQRFKSEAFDFAFKEYLWVEDQIDRFDDRSVKQSLKHNAFGCRIWCGS